MLKLGSVASMGLPKYLLSAHRYGRNRLAGKIVFISGIHEKELKLMKKHFAIAILLILVFAVSISTVLAETPITQSFDM